MEVGGWSKTSGTNLSYSLGLVFTFCEEMGVYWGWPRSDSARKESGAIMLLYPAANSAVMDW